jgi:serine protease Do
MSFPPAYHLTVARTCAVPHPLGQRALAALSAMLLAFTLAASACLAADPMHTPLSFAPVVKQVAPSVVTILASKTVKNQGLQLPPGMDEQLMRRFFGPEAHPNDERGQKMEGRGSGVIVSAEGIIITNNHVVADADDLKVVLPSGREEYEAKVIGTDPKTDIAVLRINVGHPLPAITFGDSSKVEVGDLVLAIGNPFGIGQTVTMGIISARGREMSGNRDSYEDFLQTDAAINPGNSGGALVDATGALIGINAAIISPSGGNNGIGFAVPVNLAHGVMQSLVTKGKVVRGFLGLMIQPVTADIAKAFALPNEEGALIGDVVVDGPAAKAGVKAGDVVLSFNGTRINEARQLRLLASQTSPGTMVTLALVRDGKPMSLQVTLQELVARGEKAAPEGEAHAQDGGKAKLGVALADLDGTARERFEIPRQVQGALITEVIPGSRADLNGLSAGGVIMEVNRKPVASAKAAADAIGDSDGSLVLRLWTKDGVRFQVVRALK